MINEHVLKKLVKAYVYLAYSLSAVTILFFSTAPLIARILLCMFFYLVYRSLYKIFFMSESEMSYLRKLNPSFFGGQKLGCLSIIQAIFIGFMMWGITYVVINNYVPLMSSVLNIVAVCNSLIYSFFFLVGKSE